MIAPRRAVSSAWPVPCAKTFTVIPVFCLKIGSRYSNKPEPNGMSVTHSSSRRKSIRTARSRDRLGTRVEVDAGVKAGDQVILNPPVNLRVR
jgi:hypothetical protein